MHHEWAPSSDDESVSDPAPDPSLNVPESSSSDFSSWSDSSFADPTTAASQDTLMTYDLNGNPLTVKDANLNTWTTTWDGKNRPLTVSDPLGHVTAYGYDALNRQTSETDAVGTASEVTMLLAYDAVGKSILGTNAPINFLENIFTNVIDVTMSPMPVCVLPPGVFESKLRIGRSIRNETFGVNA